MWGLLRGGIPSPCWILWPRCDRQEGMGGHSGVYVRREPRVGHPQSTVHAMWESLRAWQCARVRLAGGRRGGQAGGEGRAARLQHWVPPWPRETTWEGGAQRADWVRGLGAGPVRAWGAALAH